VPIPRTVAALVLALLAVPLAAQEARRPLLASEGASLYDFDVRLDLSPVARGTPEALATSFAHLLEDQDTVRRHFARLFREEHLDILRRYYALEMVRKQAEWYDGLDLRDYHVEVDAPDTKGDAATVRLKSRWLDARGRPGGSDLVLHLARKDGGWWIVKVQDDVPGKGLQDRGLGVPPEPPAITVPLATEPNLGTPEATVRSLHADIRRLGTIRNRASVALQRHFFSIAAAFYGADVAEHARANRPKPEPQPEIFLQTLDTKPRMGDMVRVKVLVNERVPGSEDLVSAVGEAAFDLRPISGKWRVVNEFRRPKPESSFVPLAQSLGLLFLVGG